jgi:hypothetical protein
LASVEDANDIGDHSACLDSNSSKRACELMFESSELERKYFVQEPYRSTDEYAAVTSVANVLFEHLRDAEITSQILAAKQRASSGQVQNALLEHARQLGFRDESRRLSSKYASGLCPDCVRTPMICSC